MTIQGAGLLMLIFALAANWAGWNPQNALTAVCIVAIALMMVTE